MNERLKHYQDKLSYEIDSSDLFEAMQNKENVIIIDARKAFAYEAEHIPQAINIPHREMDEITSRDLNRDTLYVIYCDGIGCNASTKGALNMTKLGFRVKELIGGIEWWKFDGYPTEGPKSQSAKEDTQCSC